MGRSEGGERDSLTQLSVQSLTWCYQHTEQPVQSCIVLSEIQTVLDSEEGIDSKQSEMLSIVIRDTFW